MDKSDDNVEEQTVVRKTRSGRTTVTPVKTKPTTRKTRKKMVLVEVDVSDEEELPTSEIQTSDKTIDDAVNQDKTEESLIHSSDISITFNCDMEMTETFLTDDANGEKNDEIEQMDEVVSEPIVSEPMEADEEVKEVEEVVGVNVEEVENITDDLPGVNSEGIGEIKAATEGVDSDDKEDEIGDVKEELDELKAVEDIKEVGEDIGDLKEEVDDAKEKMEDIKEIVEDVTDKPENMVEAEPEDVEMEPVEDTPDSDGAAEESDGAKEESADMKEEPKPAEKVVIQTADPDAENISEDELPGVQVAKVPETEEVSDEELPGPKRAELPADTEVVSEDELPAVKKEGTKRKVDEGDYDPGSPTSESEVSSKKPFLDPDIEKEKEKVEKPKKLPELDKYWKAVNDDPADFTGWTYLLQYVDQENDMEAAREAYDAFLSHYPYCYGYWRKYADYEKRKGNKKKCEEVFERGLRAIPLSVDLWIHYLTYVRTTKPDDEDFIRSQFERAVGACGLEFRSDRLWDSYVKWETDGKRPQNATALYDRLLATPTQGYTSHFDNFQEHVANNPPNKILEVDEFLALRKEVKHMLKHETAVEPADNADTPPGEDTQDISTDEETKSIRERIISIRRKIHKNTTTAVTSRWNFEEGIKRPYFHVKPLERCQLKNWQEYLDYEIEQGDQTRIIVLFERCLIACALYEEFWLRFVHYLEGLSDPELHQKIKDVYERACTIHHIKKPTLHLQWAMFEESVKNFNKAAEILVNIEKSVPNMLQIAYRRINLERRREDNEKCSQLYEHYIANSKNKVISTNLSIKFARFCLKVLNDVEKAYEALNVALTKEPNNPRIYLQLIDLTLHKDGVCEKEVLGYIDAFLEKEGIEIDQKVLFAQRKLEFLEDFGTDIQSVKTAYDEYQKYVKLNKEVKKKDTKSDTVGKKEKNPPLPASQANAYGSYGNYANSSTPGAYQYSGSQQGQYNYAQYGQGDQYQYGNWQYPQGSYSGYNQWSGYGSGYGY